MGMNSELIGKLSKLKLEETSIKRELDRYYRDDAIRSRMFKRLKQIKKEQDKLQFKLRMEKMIKNENSDTNRPRNEEKSFTSSND